MSASSVSTAKYVPIQNISELPDDLFPLILFRVDIQTFLKSVPRICKRFHTLSNKPELWKKIYVYSCSTRIIPFAQKELDGQKEWKKIFIRFFQITRLFKNKFTETNSCEALVVRQPDFDVKELYSVRADEKITCSRFYPISDLVMIATRTEESYRLIILQFSTGKILIETSKKDENSITHIHYDYEIRRLLTGFDNGTVTFWDEDLEELKTFKDNQGDGVRSVSDLKWDTENQQITISYSDGSNLVGDGTKTINYN